MEIYSDSIREYIFNNIRTEEKEEISQNDLNKIEELKVDYVNYNFEVNAFSPKEIQYFTNLRKCIFSGFEIDDEIIESLNILEKLNYLYFDYCNNKASRTLSNYIETIYLNCSSFDLLKTCSNTDHIKTITMRKVDNVSASFLKSYPNLKKLNLHDCFITDTESLLQLDNNIKIELIGCGYDNIDLIDEISKKENIYYSNDPFLFIE